MCNKSNNNGDGKRLPCRPKCYRRKRENNRENVQYRNINERVETLQKHHQRRDSDNSRYKADN